MICRRATEMISDEPKITVQPKRQMTIPDAACKPRVLLNSGKKPSKGKSTTYLSIVPTVSQLYHSGEEKANNHQKAIYPMYFYIGHRLHHGMNLGATANWISM